MSSNRRVLNVNQPIVNSAGTMERQFQEWQQLVTRALPIRGDVTPENNVIAPADSWYINESGGAGSRVYLKVFSDIGGDESQGWEVIG